MKPVQHAFTIIMATAALAVVAIMLSWSTLPAQEQAQGPGAVSVAPATEVGPHETNSGTSSSAQRSPDLIGPATYRSTAYGFRLLVPSGWRLYDDSAVDLGPRIQLVSDDDGLSMNVYPKGGWGKGTPAPIADFQIVVDGHSAVWTEYEPIGDYSFAIISIAGWFPGGRVDVAYEGKYERNGQTHSLLDGILFLGRVE